MFFKNSVKWPILTVFLLIVVFAGGCATTNGNGVQSDASAERPPFPGSRKNMEIEPTVVSYPDYHDPLIYLNRGVFAFNDVTYRFFLIPLSQGYMKVIPDPVHKSVGNFFHNIKSPVYVVNYLLQTELKQTGRSLLRFGINSTIGVLGLFDPAKSWMRIEKVETDFDDTLTVYGAGYGIYLVLPIFGPSDLRGAAAFVVDHFLDPITYLTGNPERTAIQGYDFFQNYAPNADTYKTLRKKSEDPYIFFRNLHLQRVQRDADYK